MKNYPFVMFLAVVLVVAGCSQKTGQSEQQTTGGIEKTPFGKLPDGREVVLYTLSNTLGMTMKVMNYGGIIVSLTAPDKNGNYEDIVLGYDSLPGYLKDSPYFGALIGRYGNRIAKGRFTLDGMGYQLAQNNLGNHLHGGLKGFDKVLWDIEPYPVKDGVAIKLTYTSNDMEEGYPGTLRAEVIYTLTSQNALKINYTATTDKKTIVNLTQHTYFNLSGNGKRDILQHELMLDADSFLPVDETLIPTGELRKVEGTPFDFRKPVAIGLRIGQNDEQLRIGGGYDHCWVLNGRGDSPRKVATLYDPVSGRLMMVYTTQPGIQFYSGNFLDGSITGKNNVIYNKHYGLCLETQHYPDSPNIPDFPTVVLNPGEVYSTETVYAFSVK